ncbi:receptor-like protein kinase FERONIA [Salvia miltiorrhiza]|uniref:receptor-like protein kinase FERONIA n=1 Tax=Salvia miltiorrhiza TaxID=226208 RepID=UPI0025ABF8ED|nr:receptor-like protein kinase FERONIA [Salvia miltiorrhiza]
MMSHSLYLFLLTSIFSTAQISSASTPAYTATELILLNCGASTIANDTSLRSWDSDTSSRYMPLNAASISSASEASTMDPSVFPVPYQTARLFHSPFTYTFPLTTGQKFLRLYFYPDAYSDYNTSQSLFSLTANDFTLLTDFSAFFYSKNNSLPSFCKEFIINIDQQQQRLTLTFFPNPYSFAFVNGIEIVSGPDKLYFKGNDVPIRDVYLNGVTYLQNNTALENLHRLNVGGAAVGIANDSGMFRGWSPDDDFIFGADYGYTPHLENTEIKYTPETPPYSAPPIVYTSARVMSNTNISLEWGFPVDSGFYYLLRLHFCEFTLDVTEKNQRVLTVAINNQMAEINFDVITWAGGPDIPIFRDYITWVPDDGRHRKQDLRLSLFPMVEVNPKYASALLNGLEIFKLSDAKRSLAAANPDLTVDSSTPDVPPPLRKRKSGGSSIIYAVTGSVAGVLAVVTAIGFLIFRRRRKMKDSATSVAKSSTGSSWSTARTSGSAAISLPTDLCRYFSFDDIKTATRNFDHNFVIGKGGFGNVYKGLIDHATTTVAIKRLNPSSSQGAREFLTEIEMLSKLRHLHLVSLIGYCDDDGEMILVYDYMAHGSLRDHIINNSENSPLTWKQRLQISMGAAKGLHYLHSGTKHAIIHRDVKSTNILLDHDWVAKISDFGLSKMGNSNDSFTHISTNVKGTFGYLDPKYLSTNQLTRKSDVYAYGVVLFELLSGRPAVDVRLDEEQHSLAGWARFCVREGQVDRLIDTNLAGQISAACLNVFVGIAGRCIHIQPLERPTMADVVMGLELALALQLTTEVEDITDHSQQESVAPQTIKVKGELEETKLK